ncbi:F-box/kelch-repeat protein At1g57790-like [Cryptomeria japonica]|uniref:F-box/kelch-repeat protein At1g57790-like n=1 Tax=Cryptomeria japonica TaxID=3369 RepID=UPI0027DA4582|nr:F-box/kelch-repeat protein At1g57790-like [Cryptomeria japonica]
MIIIEPYEPDEGLLLDLVSALKSESEMNQKGRIGMNGEQIEMDNKIWSRIPEELLIVVLSSLPTIVSRNFRVVCKRWQDLLLPSPMFREISSTIVPSSSPAFLVGPTYSHSEKTHRLYLLDSQPLGVYPFSLDFLGPGCFSVLTSCKGILCCRSSYTPFFYIFNPLTRASLSLMSPADPIRLPHKLSSFDFVRYLGFYGLAFDSATRSCILVIGYNNPINGERNNMEMQIYDSYTNEWSLINMNLSNSIIPSTGGIYSKGSFYWINGDSSMIITFHLAVFNVANRNWSIIQLPSGPENSGEPSHWNLTGSDGNVLVAYKKDLSLWKLDEENNSWSELHLFPRSLREENMRRLNDHSRRNLGIEVVVNSCGWILVYMGGCKMIVFDAQGRIILCIQGKLLEFFQDIGCSWDVFGYEINNVWWP